MEGAVGILVVVFNALVIINWLVYVRLFIKVSLGWEVMSSIYCGI